MWDTFRHIWKAQFIEDYFVKRGFFTRPLRETAPLGLIGDLMWLAMYRYRIWSGWQGVCVRGFISGSIYWHGSAIRC